MIFFMHHRRHLRLLLPVSKCIKMAIQLKSSQATNPRLGSLIRYPRLTLWSAFQFYLSLFFILLLTERDALCFRSAPTVPRAPKVSQVRSVPSFSSFSKAPKAPFAPKIRFAPRAPLPKFPPRVKRVVPPMRPKPVRLTPLVNRAPVVQRARPVRVVPKRRF